MHQPLWSPKSDFANSIGPKKGQIRDPLP
jgi:hypothetical protein